jgi:hypothetical protein
MNDDQVVIKIDLRYIERCEADQKKLEMMKDG